MNEKIVSLLALIFGIKAGSPLLIKLLERFPDPRCIWEEGAFSIGFKTGIPPKKLAFFKNRKSLFKRAVIEYEKAYSSGINLLPFYDPTYPKLLKEIYSPPAVLYCKGNVDTLSREGAALVGTRYPTAAGGSLAFRISRLLADKGILIVSGGARGIDTSAHRGALEAGGATVAVLGCGIDEVYPRENRGLLKEISQSGVVVSEFPFGSQPLKHHFPMRNRIIAGLCKRTLVVQAPLRSGALITARFALEQGRDVLACPWNESLQKGQGCLKLLADGAGLVIGGEELLEEEDCQTSLGFIDSYSIFRSAPGLSTEEGLVLKGTGAERTHLSRIAAAVSLPVNRTAAIMQKLELRNLVRSWAGCYYTRLFA